MAQRAFASPESFEDYYQLLHLHPSADAAMVDQAYWHLARLYNQEGSTSSEARRKLDLLNEAYSTLRSPLMREAYDQMRNDILGEGAMPVTQNAEPLAPPLAVMEKQRPRPRQQVEKEEPESESESRLPRFDSLPRVISPEMLAVLPWQSALGAVTVAILAGAALISGVQPALVFLLLVVGLALLMLPLARKLPRLHAFPSPDFHMPAIRAQQHIPHRQSFAPTARDMDSLRASTEAMRRRWREEIEPASRARDENSQPPRSR